MRETLKPFFFSSIHPLLLILNGWHQQQRMIFYSKAKGVASLHFKWLWHSWLLLFLNEKKKNNQQNLFYISLEVVKKLRRISRACVVVGVHLYWCGETYTKYLCSTISLILWIYICFSTHTQTGTQSLWVRWWWRRNTKYKYTHERRGRENLEGDDRCMRKILVGARRPIDTQTFYVGRQ